MTHHIKTALFLSLGLSLGNSLVAMDQAPKNNSEKEIMEQIIVAIKGMNKVCLETTKSIIAEYESQQHAEDLWTNQTIIQDLLSKGARASHTCQACIDYTILKSELKLSNQFLLDEVNEAVQGQRRKWLPQNPDKTYGNFTHIDQALEAVEQFCIHNVIEVEKIFQKNFSDNALSQTFEGTLRHELDHQT